jgi:hypothetical protein
MKLVVAVLSAAAIAFTASPALAKSKSKYRAYDAYAQAYVPGGGCWAGYCAPGPNGAWVGRNDPSLGHPSAGALSRASGRCVEDLGYGRFKYCGW